MRILILIIGVFVFLSGCATTPGDTQDLKSRVALIEGQLQKEQEENLQLKEKIAEFERAAQEKSIVRMPSAAEIQEALKSAGFYQGKIDGQIGSQTKESIRKFQQANGLTGDGVVGSRTWELLKKYLQSENTTAEKNS